MLFKKNFSFFFKFKEKFKDLNNNNNNKQNENSIPAKPKKKKVKEKKFNSSNSKPLVIANTYKIIQINSEINSKVKKFELLKKKIKKLNQKIKIQ